MILREVYGESRPLFAVVVVLIALALPASALAAAGDPDPSFNGTGQVTTGFGTTPFHAADTGSASAKDGSGRIYIAGTTPANNDDIAVVRLTAAGALDTSFGSNGIVTTDVASGSDDRGSGILIDGSGNVVVAGTTGDQGDADDFVLLRYTSAGALDSAFGGGDGIVTTDFSGNQDEAFGVALLGSGNLVVAGDTDTDATGATVDDFALASYTSGGALDSTFDGDGKVTTDFGSDDDQAFAVLATGSNVVAAGRTDPSGSDAGDFAIARYTASSGALDSSFDGDGKQTVDFNGETSNGDYANALALDASNNILLAGSAAVTGGNSNFGVARLTSTGALDSGFNSTGKAQVDFPSSVSADYANAVAVQSDGKVVVAGGTGGEVGDGRFMLARLTSAGAPDSGFDGDGILTTNFIVGSPFGDDDGATGVLLNGTSTIVATGTGNHNFAAVRYSMTDGSLDTGFGTAASGKAEVDVVTPVASSEAAVGVALQPDGKAVVVGPTDAGATSQFKGDLEFGVVRYNPDGSLDQNFGVGGLDGNGLVTTNFASNPDTSGTEDSPTSVALQSDGKIVVAGKTDPVGADTGDFAVARYLADGTLDPDFGGGDGLVTTDFGGGSGGFGGDYANAVAVEGTPGAPSFRIVATGAKSGASSAQEDFAIAVYGEDGTPDNTFDTDGKQTTSVGFGDIANGVAIQADGKIVAGGQSGAFGDTDFALVRYQANGTPDPSFDSDGMVTTDFASGFDAASAVAIQELGGGQVRIVLTGRADVGSGVDGALASYTTDGSLDPGFNGNGKLPVSLGSGFGRLLGVAFQQDGKVVASGSVDPANFGVIRVTSAGSLDPSFGGDGLASTSFGVLPYTPFANGLAVLPDQRIVAVGGGLPVQNGGDFLLARYLADPPPSPPSPPSTTSPSTTTPSQTITPAPKKKCKKGFVKKKVHGKKKCVRKKRR